MNYFPLMMNIDYKKVVIVGGGNVARQKVQALLPTKAMITVVSPEVVDSLQHYIAEGKVTWKQKQFEPVDLDDAVLIFAVTNETEVNDAVEEAAQHWQLLNRADAKGRMDFMNPAVVRRDELVLTVSTSGASPALTRKIKHDLAAQYDETYVAYIAFLKAARQQILEKFQGDEKKAALDQLLDPKILQWVKQNEYEKCDAFLRQLIKGE